MLLLLQIFNTFLHSSRQSVCLSGSFSLPVFDPALSVPEWSNHPKEMEKKCMKIAHFLSPLQLSGRGWMGQQRRRGTMSSQRAAEKKIRFCTRRSMWGRQEFFSTYLGSALPLALSPSSSRFVRRYMSWLLCPRGGFSIPDDAKSGAKTSEHKFFCTK